MATHAMGVGRESLRVAGYSATKKRTGHPSCASPTPVSLTLYWHQLAFHLSVLSDARMAQATKHTISVEEAHSKDLHTSLPACRAALMYKLDAVEGKGHRGWHWV